MILESSMVSSSSHITLDHSSVTARAGLTLGSPSVRVSPELLSRVSVRSGGTWNGGARAVPSLSLSLSLSLCFPLSLCASLVGV